MASIRTDRGAGQGRAQRAGFAGRRSLTSAAIGAFVGQTSGNLVSKMVPVPPDTFSFLRD
jgi:hypothetical protein